MIGNIVGNLYITSNRINKFDTTNGILFNVRAIKKINTPSFVVVDMVYNLSIQSPGFLIPENYNPELNYLEIAKKAGIL